MIFGMTLPDAKESYALEIRRGVVQFHKTIPEKADVVLEMDRAVLNSIILGDFSNIDDVSVATPKDGLMNAFKTGKTKLTKGSQEDFAKFFSYFDPLNKEPVPIAIK